MMTMTGQAMMMLSSNYSPCHDLLYDGLEKFYRCYFRRVGMRFFVSEIQKPLILIDRHNLHKMIEGVATL